MDPAALSVETEIEATHWWFRGRRRLLGAALGRLAVDPQAPTLDIGTGTGSNLRMLRDLGFARVSGLDLSPDAIRHCVEKGLGPVHHGDICNLPFPDASFQTVIATDVLEHVDDDRQALSEVARVLRSGGHALLTVPAYMGLWGVADDITHHRRRYTQPQLLRRVQRAGLRIQESCYFNTLLLMPIWFSRLAIRLAALPVSNENLVNTSLVNTVLEGIFRLDVALAPRLRPPFGVSILAVATR
jgi:SAM-dependent methyltransferase